MFAKPTIINACQSTDGAFVLLAFWLLLLSALRLILRGLFRLGLGRSLFGLFRLRLGRSLLGLFRLRLGRSLLGLFARFRASRFTTFLFRTLRL